MLDFVCFYLSNQFEMSDVPWGPLKFLIDFKDERNQSSASTRRASDRDKQSSDRAFHSLILCVWFSFTVFS